MKKLAYLSITCGCFALLLVNLSISGGVKAASKKNKNYVDGRILLKLRDDVDQQMTDDKVGEIVAGVRGSRFTRLEQDAERGPVLVQLRAGASVEEAIAEASQNPLVEYAEPDYRIYPAAVPDDTFFQLQWHLLNNGFGLPGADINATNAWDLTTGSDDVVVAVIDTGADLQHPDLAPNRWVNPREIPGNGVDDDGNGFVDDVNGWNFISNKPDTFEDPVVDAHATFVSGLIGAVGNNEAGVSGVAWHVKLMSLKFIGGDSGSASDAVKAINYVIDQKKRGTNVRIINASWGGPGNSASLENAIRKANKQGISFVCAAGNGGNDGSGDDLEQVADYPSTWSTEVPSIISVAALDANDQLASFSNFGHSVVQVGAPGVQVFSTNVGGTYSSGSGTSFSAPLVSGIVALLVAREPELTPSQIRDRIVRTADPLGSLASKVQSSGRANAFNVLTNTVPHGPLKPVIGSVSVNKKFVFVDGVGFVNGSSVIEIDGMALGKLNYDSSFVLADGSTTRISSKLGKDGIKVMLPQF